MADPFGPTLGALARGEPITIQQQAELSDLGGPELADFRAAWDQLHESERVRVLPGLKRLAGGNLRLDFNALYRAVLDDAAPQVRAAALKASIEDTSGQYLDALLKLLERDPSPAVREAAAESLAPFAYRGEVGALDEQSSARVQQALMAKVQAAGEEVGVRVQALASLGYFSAPQAQALVQASLQDPTLEGAAVRAMGRSADSQWLGRVLEYSHRPEAELRKEAATALGEIEDGRAVPRLVELLDDPDPEVCVAALRALGQIGGDQARRALRRAARAKDPAVALTARQALEELEVFEEPLTL